MRSISCSRRASLYRSSLSTPAFQVEVTTPSRLTATSFDKRAVVILNDTPFPPAAGGNALRRYLERGGGLLVATGDHTSWPQGEAALLPGRLGATIDRTTGRSGSLGYLDYSHPVFEVFKAPRSGDFSAAHVFRYRALQTDPADRVLARFDDGAIAAAERKVGAGRSIVWTSTLDDSWTDIGVKPVFLPLVHQFVRYLAHYEPSTSWFTVGQVLDLTARAKNRADHGDRIVVTPSGERVTQQAAGEGNEGLLELEEQGIYEVRPNAAVGARPEAIAVNLDPAESDLNGIDPRELVAAVTGKATPTTAQATETQEMTREESERRQSLWWYLLLAGLLLLAAETAISNHLSRKEKFL
jgi:hypothetical protein